MDDKNTVYPARNFPDTLEKFNVFMAALKKSQLVAAQWQKGNARRSAKGKRMGTKNIELGHGFGGPLGANPSDAGSLRKPTCPCRTLEAEEF